MVYLTTISMYYVLYKMGNSKSETEGMKIKKLKMIVILVHVCKPACAPLFSCAHSIVKLRAMVIHVRVYARRLTIHIHFFFVHRLNRAEITGICHGRGQWQEEGYPGGGGGGHSTFKWSGCAAGGLKIGPCLKPLGARKIYPVLIHLTKDVHMHTLF